MTDEIAVRPSGVPALSATPALEITADDVALPRLKIGQAMSNIVQEADSPVGLGDIFTSLGEDDPDAQVVYEVGADEGLLVHVLSMTRGKSVSEGGELIIFDYNDPDAPADAWVTYNYVVVLPEHDVTIPFKWLLTRTGRPAAQQMNMVLARNSASGPPYEQAFRVTTAQRENKKGKYYVPRVRHVEADAEHVAACKVLSDMISPDAASLAATGEEPAI